MANPKYRAGCDVLDTDALLVDVLSDLRAVTTRIANRARMNDEADDIRLLIGCTRTVLEVQRRVLQHHPNRRT